jgi:hypothetical protein
MDGFRTCVFAPDNSQTRAINALSITTTGAFTKNSTLRVNHAQGIA